MPNIARLTQCVGWNLFTQTSWKSSDAPAVVYYSFVSPQSRRRCLTPRAMKVKEQEKRFCSHKSHNFCSGNHAEKRSWRITTNKVCLIFQHIAFLIYLDLKHFARAKSHFGSCSAKKTRWQRAVILNVWYWFWRELELCPRYRKRDFVKITVN